MPHTPRRPEADPEWQQIHEAADQYEADLSRALLLTFAAMASRVVLLRIRAALRFGNVDAVLQAVPLAQILVLRPLIEEALYASAIAGAKVGLEAEMIVRLGTATGLPTQALTFWARQRSASLVVGITEQTRRALREAIVRALQLGLSPAKATPLIEAVIGLNTVQARALLRRYDELVAQGVLAVDREAILAQYARQLIRQRARVIARHELLQAANEGRRAIWRRDVREGLIAPSRWEREWVAIVPSDGRTCPYCEGQDGARAPIDGVYPDGSSGPPGHVLCRCTEVLRRIMDALGRMA